MTAGPPEGPSSSSRSHDYRAPLSSRPPLPPSEVFNLATHASGAVVAAVGLVYLLLRAKSAAGAFVYAVYGVSLVVLFVASTLHHAFPHGKDPKRWTRRFDMISVYCLIAGTYTPLVYALAPRSWGVPFLVGLWVVVLAAIALLVVRPFANRWATISVYVGLGWVAVALIPALASAMSATGLALMVGGGVLYTVGAVVYARKRPDLWPRYVGFHGVWHVFVLAAAACHWALIGVVVAPV